MLAAVIRLSISRRPYHASDYPAPYTPDQNTYDTSSNVAPRNPQIGIASLARGRPRTVSCYADDDQCSSTGAGVIQYGVIDSLHLPGDLRDISSTRSADEANDLKDLIRFRQRERSGSL